MTGGVKVSVLLCNLIPTGYSVNIQTPKKILRDAVINTDKPQLWKLGEASIKKMCFNSTQRHSEAEETKVHPVEVGCFSSVARKKAETVRFIRSPSWTHVWQSLSTLKSLIWSFLTPVCKACKLVCNWFSFGSLGSQHLHGSSLHLQNWKQFKPHN